MEGIAEVNGSVVGVTDAPARKQRKQPLLTCPARPGEFTLEQAAAMANRSPAAIRVAVARGKACGGYTFAWVPGTTRGYRTRGGKVPGPVKAPKASVGSVLRGIAPVEQPYTPDGLTAAERARVVAWAERVKRDFAVLQVILGDAPDGPTERKPERTEPRKDGGSNGHPVFPGRES